VPYTALGSCCLVCSIAQLCFSAALLSCLVIRPNVPPNSYSSPGGVLDPRPPQDPADLPQPLPRPHRLPCPLRCRGCDSHLNLACSCNVMYWMAAVRRTKQPPAVALDNTLPPMRLLMLLCPPCPPCPLTLTTSDAAACFISECSSSGRALSCCVACMLCAVGGMVRGSSSSCTCHASPG